MKLDEKQAKKVKKVAPRYGDGHYLLHVETDCGFADIGLLPDGNGLKTEVEDAKINEILECWLRENEI
jgi:alkyl hydroperoxide reductase subunit AhpF|tara:strand:+ start:13599 stop:13802 length:204 start_codon:yes stop_codon:yes gene_type:complete